MERYTKILQLDEYNHMQGRKWSDDYDKALQIDRYGDKPQILLYVMKPNAHYGYVAYGENCAKWFKTKRQALNFINNQ